MFNSVQVRFREICGIQRRLRFPDCAVNERERDTNLLMSSETTRMHRRGSPLFARARVLRRSHPRRENDDECFAPTRNLADIFAFMLCQPCAAVIRQLATIRPATPAGRIEHRSYYRSFFSWIKSRYDRNRCLVPVLKQI